MWVINMTTEIIDMGKISSRGQVAIPTGIRTKMGLNEGEKVLFWLKGDTLMIRKVSFEELTAPFQKGSKKISESEVNCVVHKLRK